MSQHKGPPELCLDCRRDRAHAEWAYLNHRSKVIEDLRKARRFYLGRAVIQPDEADPDVADTAWAIIDHHRQHRTAG